MGLFSSRSDNRTLRPKTILFISLCSDLLKDRDLKEKDGLLS